MRQSESEAKKSRVNKARVSAANQEVEDYNAKLESVDGALNDWFSLLSSTDKRIKYIRKKPQVYSTGERYLLQDWSSNLRSIHGDAVVNLTE